MGYIQSTIINGENIIQEAKMSKWFFAKDILFSVVIFIFSLSLFTIQNKTNSQYLIYSIMLLGGLIVLVNAYITYISTELAFTNKRVIAKVGFIKRDTVEMNISKVETIQVHQGVMGRILNYGTIVISGAGNPQAPIKGIAKPLQFRNKFMEFTSNHA